MRAISDDSHSLFSYTAQYGSKMLYLPFLPQPSSSQVDFHLLEALVMQDISLVLSYYIFHLRFPE